MHLVEGFELRLRRDRTSEDGEIRFVPGQRDGWTMYLSDRVRQDLKEAGIFSDTRFSTLHGAVAAADAVVGCGARTRTSRCYLVRDPADEYFNWRVFPLEDGWRLFPHRQSWTQREVSHLTDLRFKTRIEALRHLRLHPPATSSRSLIAPSKRNVDGWGRVEPIGEGDGG